MTTQQKYILAGKSKVSGLPREAASLCFFVYSDEIQTNKKYRTYWQYKWEVEQCHTLSPLLSHRNMSWSNESNEQCKCEIFIASSWKPCSSVRLGVQSIKHHLATQRNLNVHAVLFFLDFSVAKCHYLP